MTDQSIIVIATLHPVPLEDGTGSIAPDAPARRVPNTLFYRRRVKANELRVVSEEDPAPTPAPDAAPISNRLRNRPAQSGPAPAQPDPPPSHSEEAA